LRRADGPRGGRYFPGLRGYLRRAYGPGWALVGDAGYFKDPITAHGITDALRDAELLAHAVERGLGLRDEAAHLAAYQAERDRLSLPLFEVAQEIAGFEWDDDTVHSLLLRLNSSMALEVEALLAFEAAGDAAWARRRAPRARDAGRHGGVTPTTV
jgi:flavin-dependent dehydrogenase